VLELDVLDFPVGDSLESFGCGDIGVGSRNSCDIDISFFGPPLFTPASSSGFALSLRARSSLNGTRLDVTALFAAIGTERVCGALGSCPATGFNREECVEKEDWQPRQRRQM
jgi:hypothetical protein